MMSEQPNIEQRKQSFKEKGKTPSKGRIQELIRSSFSKSTNSLSESDNSIQNSESDINASTASLSLSGITESNDEISGSASSNPIERGRSLPTNVSGGSVNMDLFPYWKDIMRYYSSVKTGGLKEQLKGVAEIGYASWNGGDQAQNHIGKCGIIDYFIGLLNDPQHPLQLKLKVVQSLSMICRNHSQNQEIMCQLNSVNVLYEFLNEENEELRMWSAHCLFFLLSGCASTQNAALRIKNMKERLMKVSIDDWTMWSHNDALEVLKLLGFIPPGDIEFMVETNLTKPTLLLRQYNSKTSPGSSPPSNK
eukprot:TRINITY_DN614_c0_g2_i4.p1 TRINITY_DN614_c0_g2~~TRINITY_DN614_c0_g2_i4.p1  ORF type:complete len:307 (-),score=46.85 TRINITY_DN614_c0_g2_i4:183-1103(-)